MTKSTIYPSKISALIRLTKYWIAEGSKGLRSIQRKGANQFEAINEAIILDGPYSNSSYDIVSKNDKIYIIPGGKSLTGDNSFNKAGSVMIYDYENGVY